MLSALLMFHRVAKFSAGAFLVAIGTLTYTLGAGPDFVVVRAQERDPDRGGPAPT